MTLRSKTILIVTAALVSLLALLYISSRAVLLRSFAELERDVARRDVQRALNVLENRIKELDTIAYDWASWDDTYRFMQDRNPAYVESNLLDDTLAALNLNALLLVAPSGEVVFEKALDLREEDETLLPHSLLDHLTADGLLSPAGEPGSHTTGLLQLPEGPMLVSSRPILTSEDEGPSRGWLIMAQYLDSTEVESLARITDSALTIQPFHDATASDQLEAVRATLLETPSAVVVRPESADVVAGYSVLQDIYGAPAVLVGVEMPREIYYRGQAAVAYLLTAILLVGLAFGTLQCVMLDRQVLARVMALTRGVARIRTHDDLSATLQADGRDELSRLGAETNEMLSRLRCAQSDLRVSEQRYRELVQSANDIIYTHDLDGNLTSANPYALMTYGYSAEEIPQLKVTDLVAPDFLAFAERMLQDFPSQPLEAVPYELLTHSKSGDPIWLEVSSRVVQPEGATPEIQSIGRNITERKQAEQALRIEKERFDILLEEFPLAVAIVGQDGRYQYFNPMFVQTFGYTLSDIPTGRDWFKQAYPDPAYRRQVISTWRSDLTDSRPGEARPRTFTVRCKDNSDKVIHFRAATMPDGDQLVVCEDITERQRAEELIRHMAYHDSLTGLPNRLLFNDRLEAALARARRTGNKLAVMVLDLDNFKEVNDALGHATGDQLLQAVGERLTTLVRESDTVCRMGGDEFLILLTGITTEACVTKIAQRILDAVRKPFHLDDQDVELTTSLGLAIFPDDAQDMDTLVRQTDFAMYLAKELGRDNYQRFRPAEHQPQLTRPRLGSAQREPPTKP